MKPKQKAHQRYRVHFVLVQCSSTWGLLVSVIVIPSVTALEKKKITDWFPFPIKFLL